MARTACALRQTWRRSFSIIRASMLSSQLTRANLIRLASLAPREPDRVARALVVGAGADFDFLDREARFFESPGEVPVATGGPDRQHSAGRQGGFGGAQAGEGIDPPVLLVNEGVGSIVDIE